VSPAGPERPANGDRPADDERPSIEVRPASDVDREALRRHVVESWHSEEVVSNGELYRPLELPGFVAVEGGVIRGHVTYRIRGDDCELTSIDARPPRTGVGTLLMDAAEEAARSAGCLRIWLVTTNDNLDALRFYQRRGYRLSALRPGAVDAGRRLKPELPQVGSYGIPMRDELELEKSLDL
jgi:GNAT superfamily N-acetyltransferase